MSDEERERAQRLIRELGQSLVDALRPLAKALNEFAKAAHRFLDAYRKHLARDSWREAQRNARFLSRHPDLAALDRELDYWYTDPVFA